MRTLHALPASSILLACSGAALMLVACSHDDTRNTLPPSSIYDGGAGPLDAQLGATSEVGPRLAAEPRSVGADVSHRNSAGKAIVDEPAVETSVVDDREAKVGPHAP